MNELTHYMEMTDISTTTTFRVAMNDAGKKMLPNGWNC